MFKNILIAEDHEVRNLGVVKTLTELNIEHFEFVNYCDDAFAKIKNAISSNKDYDLLITDLSFDEDHIMQELRSGQELIAKVREVQPNIKIIAFSIEKRPQIVDELFKKFNINGFVSKGRDDSKELKSTIKRVYNGETVIPFEIKTSIKQNTYELSSLDITIIKLLADGQRQQDIEIYLKNNNIKPNSSSSIEKRLNDLRDIFQAKTNIELVVTCKDLGFL